MSKRKTTNRPHWLIQGFDGLSKIYEWQIDGRHISEENVQLLLKTLVGKVVLTLDEIVGAYANRRAQTANGLLRVSRDGPRLRFTCGRTRTSSPCTAEQYGEEAAVSRCSRHTDPERVGAKARPPRAPHNKQRDEPDEVRAPPKRRPSQAIPALDRQRTEWWLTE